MITDSFDAPDIAVVDLFESWFTLRISDAQVLGFAGRPARFEIQLRCCGPSSTEPVGQRFVAAPDVVRTILLDRKQQVMDVNLEDLAPHGAYDVKVRGIGVARGGGGVHSLPLHGAWATLHVPLLPSIHVAQGEVSATSLHVRWDFGGWSASTVPLLAAPSPSDVARVEHNTTSAQEQQGSSWKCFDTRVMDVAVKHPQLEPIGVAAMMQPQHVPFHRRQATHVVKWYEMEIRAHSDLDPRPQRERFAVAYVPSVTAQGGDRVIPLETAKAVRCGEAGVYFVRIRAFRGPKVIIGGGDGAEGEYGAWSAQTRFVCLPAPDVQLHRIGVDSCEITWCPPSLEATTAVPGSAQKPPGVVVERGLRDVSFSCQAARRRVTAAKHTKEPPYDGRVWSTTHIAVGPYSSPQETEDADLRPRCMRISSLAADTVYHAAWRFTFAAGGSETVIRFRFATLPAPEFAVSQSFVGARYAAVVLGCNRRSPRLTTDLADVHFLPEEDLHEGPHCHNAYRLVLERHSDVSDVQFHSGGSSAQLERAHDCVGILQVQAVHRGVVVSDVTLLNGPSSSWCEPSTAHVEAAGLRRQSEDDQELGAAFWLRSFAADPFSAPDKLYGFSKRRVAWLDGLPCGASVALRARCGLLSKPALNSLHREISIRVNSAHPPSLRASELVPLLASLCDFSSWCSVRRSASDSSLTGTTDVSVQTLTDFEAILEHRTGETLAATLLSRSWAELEKCPVEGGGWAPIPPQLVVVTIRKAPRTTEEGEAWRALVRNRNWDAVVDDMAHGQLATLDNVDDEAEAVNVAFYCDAAMRHPTTTTAPSPALGERCVRCVRGRLERLPPHNGASDVLTEGTAPEDCHGGGDNVIMVHPLEPFVSLRRLERYFTSPIQSQRVVCFSNLKPSTKYEVQFNVLDVSGTWYGPKSTLLETLPMWQRKDLRAPDFDPMKKIVGTAYAPSVDRGLPLSDDVFSEQAAGRQVRHPLVSSVFPMELEAERKDAIDRLAGLPQQHTQLEDTEGMTLESWVASRRRPMGAPAALRVAAVGFDDVVLVWNPITWEVDGVSKLTQASAITTAAHATLIEMRIRIEWCPLPHEALEQRQTTRSSHLPTTEEAQDPQRAFRYYYLRTDGNSLRVTHLSDRFFHDAAISVFDKIRHVWTPWSQAVSFTVTSPLTLSLEKVTMSGFRLSWRKRDATLDPRVLMNPMQVERYDILVQHAEWTMLAVGHSAHTTGRELTVDPAGSSAAEPLSFQETLHRIFEGDTGILTDDDASNDTQRGDGKTWHRFSVAGGETSLHVPLLLRGVLRCTVRPRYVHGSRGPWCKYEHLWVYPLQLGIQKLEQHCADIAWAVLPSRANSNVRGGRHGFLVVEPAAPLESQELRVDASWNPSEFSSGHSRQMKTVGECADLSVTSGTMRVAGLEPGTHYGVYGVVATLHEPLVLLSDTATAEETHDARLSSVSNHDDHSISTVAASARPSSTAPLAAADGSSSSSVLRRRLASAMHRFPLSQWKTDRRPSVADRSLLHDSSATVIRPFGSSPLFMQCKWLSSCPVVVFSTLSVLRPRVLRVGPNHVAVEWSRVPVHELQLPRAALPLHSMLMPPRCSADATQTEIYLVVLRDTQHGDIVVDTVTPSPVTAASAASCSRAAPSPRATLHKTILNLCPEGQFWLRVLPFLPPRAAAAAAEMDTSFAPQWHAPEALSRSALNHHIATSWIADAIHRQPWLADVPPCAADSEGRPSHDDDAVRFTTPSRMKLFCYLDVDPPIQLQGDQANREHKGRLVIFAARTLLADAVNAIRNPPRRDAETTSDLLKIRLTSGVEMLSTAPTPCGDDSLWICTPVAAAAEPMRMVFVPGLTEIATLTTPVQRAPSAAVVGSDATADNTGAAHDGRSAEETDFDEGLSTSKALCPTSPTTLNKKVTSRFSGCSPSNCTTIELDVKFSPATSGHHGCNAAPRIWESLAARRLVITARQKTSDGSSWGDLLKGTLVI